MIRIISVVVFMGTNLSLSRTVVYETDNIEVAAFSGGANHYTAECAYVSSPKLT